MLTVGVKENVDVCAPFAVNWQTKLRIRQFGRDPVPRSRGHSPPENPGERLPHQRRRAQGARRSVRGPEGAVEGSLHRGGRPPEQGQVWPGVGLQPVAQALHQDLLQAHRRRDRGGRAGEAGGRRSLFFAFRNGRVLARRPARSRLPATGWSAPALRPLVESALQRTTAPPGLGGTHRAIIQLGFPLHAGVGHAVQF